MKCDTESRASQHCVNPLTSRSLAIENRSAFLHTGQQGTLLLGSFESYFEMITLGINDVKALYGYVE